MTPRSLPSSDRIASSSAIVARSFSISSSSSVRPSRVRRPSVMSRMWVACISVKENGSAISAVRASGRSSDARMVAITASSMSMARRRPSTMWARFRAFVEAELRAAPDHLDLVVDVVRERLGQVQRAGHAVDQRQHVDAEARLQRRLLEEVVEHHVGVGVALELNDQPRLLVGRGVAQLADAVEVAGPDQLGDLLLDDLDRGLVRELGDHDAVAGTRPPRSRRRRAS